MLKRGNPLAAIAGIFRCCRQTANRLSETVIEVQQKLAPRFRQADAARALAVAAVVFVADVVDGEVDVEVVLAQRLPVHIEVMHAVTRATVGFAVFVHVAAFFGVSAAPARFQRRVVKAVCEAGVPLSAHRDGGGDGVGGRAVDFRLAVVHARARTQPFPMPGGADFVAPVFQFAFADQLAVFAFAATAVRAAVVLQVFDGLLVVAAVKFKAAKAPGATHFGGARLFGLDALAKAEVGVGEHGFVEARAA